MRLSIPSGPFKAYLFDCDGTIADSMPLHLLAWNEALAPYGAHFPADLFYAWAGIPVPRTVEMLGEHFNLKLPPQEITEAREAAYLKRLPQITPVYAVKEEIERHRGRAPMAVVSGSPRASVIRTLDYLGLLDRFAVIVGGDDCARGKPFPDPFLLAAAKLGITPTDCLVFEDGELGIEAAKAAGMQFVRVPVSATGILP
ncbi:MAG: HAD family phosphatase [Proteobacteria bacterium]|nr:MAG: HAD family phosphatase [Pseudomonadota bacterium]